MELDPTKVVVDRTARGLKITVPDNSTDSLVIIDIYHFLDGLDQKLMAVTMMRGNVSGGRYSRRMPAVESRRAVRSSLSIHAQAISKDEFDRRMALARQTEGEISKLGLSGNEETTT